MNSDLYFDGKKFISSNRAAKITGYVNDYIGQLCRDGKLDCRMVGRSWYVSFESLISHKNTNGNGASSRSHRHIKKVNLLNPLLEKGVQQEKRGITLHDFREQSGKNEEREISNENISYPHFGPLLKNQIELPPEFPVEELLRTKFPTELWGKGEGTSVFHVFKKSLIEQEKIREHKDFLALMFPRVIAGMLSVFVALVGFWFTLSSSPDTQVAYSKAFQTVQLEQTKILAAAGEKLEANIFEGVSPFIDRAGTIVYRTINGWILKTQRRILVMTGRTPRSEVIVRTEEENTRPSQGMVVVPVEENTDRQAVVAKIRNSFSDEVKIAPSADGTDGVVTPVFKKSKGDDYLYVLVPIKN